MNTDNYTPEIINDQYILLLAELKVCPICNSKMMHVPKDEYCEYNTFPKYCFLTIKDQLKRANIAIASREKQDDEFVCEKCLKEGKITFECDLCKKRRPSSEIKECFGDPPDHLCKICYASTPAMDWYNKVSELYNIHRYDFE